MEKWTPVRVTWVDSSGCGDWSHDYEDSTVFDCETVGMLIRRNEKEIVVALSVANKNAAHNEQCGHIMAIPMCAVTSIIELA